MSSNNIPLPSLNLEITPHKENHPDGVEESDSSSKSQEPASKSHQKESCFSTNRKWIKIGIISLASIILLMIISSFLKTSSESPACQLFTPDMKPNPKEVGQRAPGLNVASMTAWIEFAPDRLNKSILPLELKHVHTISPAHSLTKYANLDLQCAQMDLIEFPDSSRELLVKFNEPLGGVSCCVVPSLTTMNGANDCTNIWTHQVVAKLWLQSFRIEWTD